MRRSLIAANWKMNGSRAFIMELLDTMLKRLDAAAVQADILVCPPAPYYELCAGILQGSAVKLGAQNAHEEQSGAFTGEVAAKMLVDFDIDMVILGHSERRSGGETDEQVARKCEAVLAQGMLPIVCVGETLQERVAGQAESVVEKQLVAVLDHCGIDALSSAVVAYEPVWAIGTGETATPEQAQQMHAFIRGLVAQRSESIAAGIRILYGGSVNGANAAQLFAQIDIDGGLVGGASLKPDEFITICKSVSK
jgi:triosephosphate isomerase